MSERVRAFTPVTFTHHQPAGRVVAGADSRAQGEREAGAEQHSDVVRPRRVQHPFTPEILFTP